jgi:hypothetical protein
VGTRNAPKKIRGRRLKKRSDAILPQNIQQDTQIQLLKDMRNQDMHNQQLDMRSQDMYNQQLDMQLQQRSLFSFETSVADWQLRQEQVDQGIYNHQLAMQLQQRSPLSLKASAVDWQLRQGTRSRCGSSVERLATWRLRQLVATQYLRQPLDTRRQRQRLDTRRQRQRLATRRLRQQLDIRHRLAR